MSNKTNWHDDIGMDEINDDCYQCQIIDELGTTVAKAFGETPDDCNYNSKLIAAAPEMLQLLKDYFNYGDSRLIRDTACDLINRVVS